MGEYDTTIRTILNEGCSALLGQLGVPSTAEPERRGRASKKVDFPEINSTFVYIGREKLEMPAGITTTALKFGFAATDIRSINPKDLLASPAVGDAIMAVLCEGGGSRDTVRSILSRLKGLEQHALNGPTGS